MKDAGIDFFMEENESIRRGENISDKVKQIIEGSKVSVIVFSSRYADSIWCLEELVQIMECRRTLKQMVLPILYDLSPSDVIGTFELAFQKHRERFHEDTDIQEKLRRWTGALTAAAGLTVRVFRTTNGYEGMFIRVIIDEITKLLQSPTPIEIAFTDSATSPLSTLPGKLPGTGSASGSGEYHCSNSERGYYRSLPPVSKTYGVGCFMFAAALYFQLYNPWNIALDYGLVIKRFQVWRLVTNFFFLGPFSFPFACDLILIARYGVALERGAFEKRTADFMWMLMFGALSLLAMAAVPYLWSPFMGTSVVFMIVYVWSREFPNSRVNIAGVVSFKGFYLPYVLLTLDLMFGVPLKPDIMGMVAGHLYYFLTVLHPLSGGKFTLKTPLWVHKLVAIWGQGIQVNSPVERNPQAGVAFRGRSFRLNGSTRTSSPVRPQTSSGTTTTTQQADGVAFRDLGTRIMT